MKIKYTLEQAQEKLKARYNRIPDYSKLSFYLDDLRYMEDISARDYKALQVFIMESFL